MVRRLFNVKPKNKIMKDLIVVQTESVLPHEESGFKDSINDLKIEGLEGVYIDVEGDDILIGLQFEDRRDKLVINGDNFSYLNGNIVKFPQNERDTEAKYTAFAELYRIATMASITTVIYYAYCYKQG